MNRWMRFAVFAALISLAATSALAAGPIRTELTLDTPFLDSTQNVYVTFTMTNVSDHTVRVLSWVTPFDGVEGNLFEVARNGEPVPYEGRVYKRPAPTDADYIVLAPAESRSVEVELSRFYAISYGGEYLIRFRHASYDHNHVQDLTKSADSALIDLRSNVVSFWMDGDDPPPVVEIAPWQKAKGGNKPPKGACDNSQQATIDSALAEAQSYAADSVSYLNGSSGPRYVEWFGTYTSSRWNTVGNHFDAISDALNNAPMEWDCSCKQRYYAYVYPNQPYKIYLCTIFWQAPLTGTDSKAGTIIHETSHFDVVAGTDDVTYGQSSCRNLADTDPNAAITNADSHEYFAENNPHLN